MPDYRRPRSVRKAGQKLRITSQLIDVKSQSHLWSQDYDRELKDVLVIQSDVARNVAEALKIKLLAGEKRRIEKKGTEDLEAYNLYLIGLYHVNKLSKNELENGDLKIIPVTGFPIQSNWRLVWQKNKALSPVANAYLEFIRKEKGKIIQQYFSWFTRF